MTSMTASRIGTMSTRLFGNGCRGSDAGDLINARPMLIIAHAK